MTALDIVIAKNYPEAAELLRKAGAQEKKGNPILSRFEEFGINEPIDKNGMARLHLAVVREEPETIAQLAKLGADVGVKFNGYTALHLAVASGNVEVVRALLEAGADIAVKNDDGFTPLVAAQKMNQPQIAELLRKAETKGNVVKTQDDGRNDFLQKMIRTISKNNVNNPVFGGLTLLHLAASADTPEFIIELASKGANIEVRDKDGNTALHTAATVNKPKNIAELIKTGADTGAKNNQDMTPLHIAAMTGTVEATVALLEAGADVEARSNGNTALHLASLKGTLDIVVALLEAGASVSAETNKGATPLAIAIQKNNMEVAELLRKAGVKENHEDILLSRFDEVGINDPLDNKGTTRLHLALIRDTPEAIAQLVKMGANLESRSADGSTPLHLAVASDNARIVSALLEAGADTETKSSDGLTALHYAAGTGNVDIARMLLKAGADVGAVAPMRDEETKMITIEDVEAV